MEIEGIKGIKQPILFIADVSNKEVGLLIIIVSLIIGAIFSRENMLLSIDFLLLSIPLILIYLALLLFIKDPDWFSWRLKYVSKLEYDFISHKIPAEKYAFALRVDYEDIYFRALSEGKLELADGLKKKIDELKNLESSN